MRAFDLPVGRLEAAIMVFGHTDALHYGLPSWSLLPLQKQEDVPKNLRLINTIFVELGYLGIKEAFAPRAAAASAHIVSSSELMCADQIGLRDTLLYRNHALPADGVLLESNQAFVMSGAGCPIIIGTAGEKMIVAHAARDSLIDRGTVVGKPTRQHVSIVDAMIEKFQKHGASLDDIALAMLFAIPALEFEHSVHHPQYGEYNKKLIQFVSANYPDGILRRAGTTYLNLELVFIGQAQQAGVRRAWAIHSLAQYPQLVHTCVGENASKRNLFIIKRNA